MSKDIKVYCPNCSQPLAVPEEMMGDDIQCPTCSHNFKAVAPTNELPIEQAGILPDSVSQSDTPNDNTVYSVINCPDCRQPLNIPQEMLDEEIECPGCSKSFSATVSRNELSNIDDIHAEHDLGSYQNPKIAASSSIVPPPIKRNPPHIKRNPPHIYNIMQAIGNSTLIKRVGSSAYAKAAAGWLIGYILIPIATIGSASTTIKIIIGILGIVLGLAGFTLAAYKGPFKFIWKPMLSIISVFIVGGTIAVMAMTAYIDSRFIIGTLLILVCGSIMGIGGKALFCRFNHEKVTQLCFATAWSITIMSLLIFSLWAFSTQFWTAFLIVTVFGYVWSICILNQTLGTKLKSLWTLSSKQRIAFAIGLSLVLGVYLAWGIHLANERVRLEKRRQEERARQRIRAETQQRTQSNATQQSYSQRSEAEIHAARSLTEGFLNAWIRASSQRSSDEYTTLDPISIWGTRNKVLPDHPTYRISDFEILSMNELNSESDRSKGYPESYIFEVRVYLPVGHGQRRLNVRLRRSPKISQIILEN